MSPLLALLLSVLKYLSIYDEESSQRIYSIECPGRLFKYLTLRAGAFARLGAHSISPFFTLSPLPPPSPPSVGSKFILQQKSLR